MCYMGGHAEQDLEAKVDATRNIEDEDRTNTG